MTALLPVSVQPSPLTVSPPTCSPGSSRMTDFPSRAVYTAATTPAEVPP